MYAKLYILYNVLSFHCFPLFSKTVRQEAWEKSTKPFVDHLYICCPVISKAIGFFTFHFYLFTFTTCSYSRKEVFQPHLPVRLPCYDLAPITSITLDRPLRSRPSSAPGFHGLTGGVYKARERIHRAMADARLLANPASWSRVADSSPN